MREPESVWGSVGESVCVGGVWGRVCVCESVCERVCVRKCESVCESV